MSFLALTVSLLIHAGEFVSMSLLRLDYPVNGDFRVPQQWLRVPCFFRYNVVSYVYDEISVGDSDSVEFGDGWNNFGDFEFEITTPVFLRDEETQMLKFPFLFCGY